MSHLVLLAHASASVREAYQTKLPADVKVVPFISTFTGMSAAYTSLAYSLRVKGRILPSLVAKYAPGEWESITLASWSAGYALTREVLANPIDADALAGIVLLDSLHANLDSDGTASDAQIAPFARYARRALAGDRVCYVGHTDVPTTGYASTTKAAQELVRLVGAQGRGFLVRAFDEVPGHTVKDYEQEHRNAVNHWGPGFVGEAFAKAAQQWAAPSTERAMLVPLTGDFGQVVLDQAKADLNAGFCELGHNAGEEIERLYLTPLGLPPGSNYCAAAVASWLRRAAEASGMPLPIEGSKGAKETQAQLEKAGLWLPAEALTRDDVVAGMLVVWDRAQPGKPETAWWGHIGIVVDVGEHVFWTIEANADRGGETTAVAMVERKLTDPKLLGMGRLTVTTSRLAA